jgi:prepilin-type N-terminal cleavage/methylation domain-containing protein/prepilin-type processing-associated H-X9-DG protein
MFCDHPHDWKCDTVEIHGKARAFTLIELLIVLAVVALLAALLFGGMKRVTLGSQRAACASNMRQVGAAIHLYAAENNGQLPYCFGGSVAPREVNGLPTSGNHNKVAWDLSPYIGDEVWDCPDPMNRENREKSAAFGIVWTKSSDALTSDWRLPQAHRLLEYEKPASVHLFYCAYCAASQGPGTPGNRPWPHGGLINSLYLDGHVGNFRPTWPD